ALPPNRQPQVPKLPFHRRNGTVGDARDATSVQIEHSERFQHVVELTGSEWNRNVLVAAHFALMFEIPHAVFVKDHTLDWQLLHVEGKLSLEEKGRQQYAKE